MAEQRKTVQKRLEEDFQVKMDAHGFTPEELVVKVDGQRLMVTGQRQMEASDPERGSYRMSQKVHRQMRLPPDLDPTAMSCCLTPSGQLWVRGQGGVLPLPEAPAGREELPISSPAPRPAHCPKPRPLQTR
uniref:Heat shock protein beta-9 n=1 Tax=Prolemur simus TaxID=1328070 RepID=A0A8C9DL35_PROSS